MEKCEYHQNEEIKYSCKECGKGICQKCYDILDDIDKHTYLHDIFNKIPKNTCMTCTLFNFTKFKEVMEIDKKDIVNKFKRILILYVIGLIIFIISAISESGLMLVGFFLCGYGAWHYYIAGTPSFEQQRKIGTANYEISRGIGGYNIRQTSSDSSTVFGLFLWLIGVVSTPVYLLINMKKVKKMQEAYTYFIDTIDKLEKLTHKRYVYDKQRQKYTETTI